MRPWWLPKHLGAPVPEAVPRPVEGIKLQSPPPAWLPLVPWLQGSLALPTGQGQGTAEVSPPIHLVSSRPRHICGACFQLHRRRAGGPGQLWTLCALVPSGVTCNGESDVSVSQQGQMRPHLGAEALPGPVSCPSHPRMTPPSAPGTRCSLRVSAWALRHPSLSNPGLCGSLRVLGTGPPQPSSPFPPWGPRASILPNSRILALEGPQGTVWPDEAGIHVPEPP